jgi:L-seryl-tRNA(Ser) seleniumtransferase
MAAASMASFDSWELQAAASRQLSRISGAEAGIVTTGASAALTMAAAAVLAGSDAAVMSRLPRAGETRSEIVVPRSHRNTYDRALETAGARIIDFGINDRFTGAGVRPLEGWEVDAVIGPKTSAIAGSGSSATLEDLPVLVESGRRHGLPVIVDAAAQLPPVENLRSFIALGADLVCFSGGKAIGGPQGSGILIGRRDLIASALIQMLDMDVHPVRFRPPVEFFGDRAPSVLPRHGIGRGFKASKEAVIGLLVALEAFCSAEPVRRATEIRQRLALIANKLAPRNGLTISISEPSHPERFPRLVMHIDSGRLGFDALAFVRRLERGERPVALAESGLFSGEVAIDLTCVDPADDGVLVERLSTNLSKEPA